MKYSPKLVSRRYLLNPENADISDIQLQLNGGKNRHVTIIPERVDVIEVANRGIMSHTVLEYNDAYAAVAVTDEDRVVLVKVPRYPVGSYLWELPGGKQDSDETPEECMKRELLEETGFRADHIERLLPFYYPEPSHSTEKLGLFLATKLTHTKKALPEREGLLDIGIFELDEALRMIGNGDIKSSWTIIGILAYLLQRQLSISKAYSLINPIP